MERAPQDEQNGTTKNAESQIDAGLNVSTLGAEKRGIPRGFEHRKFTENYCMKDWFHFFEQFTYQGTNFRQKN